MCRTHLHNKPGSGFINFDKLSKYNLLCRGSLLSIDCTQLGSRNSFIQIDEKARKELYAHRVRVGSKELRESEDYDSKNSLIDERRMEL